MKFSGEVGFQFPSIEVAVDIWKPQIITKHYTGDLLKNTRRNQAFQYQNDNITLNNRISIICDMYMKENFPYIKFIVWNGVKWKVTSVDISYPRLTIEIGGVYNGESGETKSEKF